MNASSLHSGWSVVLAVWSIVLVGTGCMGRGDPGPWRAATGVEWQLIELDGRDAPPGLSIAFAEDGRVVGQGGVNRFFGTYEIPSPGGLRLSPLGRTRMAGPGLAEEDRYLRALQHVDGYRVDASSLHLLSGGDKLLRYERPRPSGPSD